MSVMPTEVIRFMQPVSGGVYLDGTLGGGGHSLLILEHSAPDGLLIGMDRDQEALQAAGERLAEYQDRIHLVHGNFSDLEKGLDSLGILKLDGFILDLGVSSHQLDSKERGFSFQQDAPLDMRMDTSSGLTAADLVNQLPEHELVRIIREYGEERWADRIAAFIVKARNEESIRSTFDLVDIVKGAVPKAKWEDRIHPATRTFQALRIAVNHELESVEQGLRAAFGRLNSGGRAVVISFHSLEDRIVKQVFRELASGCNCPKNLPLCVCGRKPLARVLTNRPVMATNEETAQNPRARSAKMRVAEKI